LSDKLFWYGRQEEIEEYLTIVFNATKEEAPLFYGFYAFILEEVNQTFKLEMTTGLTLVLFIIREAE